MKICREDLAEKPWSGFQKSPGPDPKVPESHVEKKEIVRQVSNKDRTNDAKGKVKYVKTA